MPAMDAVRQNVRRILNEAAPTRLGDIARIRVGIEDADFWVVRRGSADKVGMPVREYNPQHIGIKVERTDILLPDFLFYSLMHLHSTGAFKQVAHGTTRLVNIRIGDIANIPLGG